MQTLDFVTKRGDTFDEVSFTINIDGDPLDLTDAVIRMQLRKSAGAPVAFTPELSITDAENGQFVIDAQIIDIPACVYKYDIEIELASGEVKTWIYGNFTINDDITR